MSPATRTSGPPTLADPDRLRRFVSFVNAPDVPDPSVPFVPERDQVKPDLTLLAGPTLPVRTLEGTSVR